MKLTLITILLCVALLACQSNSTKDETTKDAPAKTDSVVRHVAILDTEALSIIDSTTAVEQLAEGCKWAEGPIVY